VQTKNRFVSECANENQLTHIKFKSNLLVDISSQ